MRLPLYLTLLRIAMGPVFLFLYLYYQMLGIEEVVLPYVLLFVVAFCELSDFFDGFLARRRRRVTELGKVLDPMADSVFRLSVFFTFTQGIVELPLIVVLFFFIRDSVIGTLRTLCALRGVALGARISGKIKAIVQATAVFFILLLMILYTRGYLDLETFQNISFYIAFVTMAYTVISGVEYILSNWDYIKKAT